MSFIIDGQTYEDEFEYTTSQIDWSKMNQPTGVVSKTDVGDSPLQRQLDDFKVQAAGTYKPLKDITPEEIETVINVAMGAGPGTIAGVRARTAKLGKIGEGTDTTWWKGSDRKYRFEISDEAMKLKDIDWKYGQEGKLSDFIEHPELFKAYPQVKDINLKVADEGEKGIASYNYGTNTIKINPAKIKSGDEGILDVLIHEIQHSVQRLENFKGKGSNPNHAYEEATNKLHDKLAEIYHKEGPDSAKFKDTLKLFDEIVADKDKFGFYMYTRNPGEVEANLVAARRKLNDRLRKEFPPKEHQKMIEGEVDSLSGATYVPEFNYP